MGDLLSRPSQPEFTATLSPTDAAAVALPSQNPKLPHGPKTAEPETPTGKATDLPSDPTTTDVLKSGAEYEAIPEEKRESTEYGDNSEEGDEQEEEEEGECGFCLFMKGGGCKETFAEWEKCVEEGEVNKEDIVEKCFQATAALKKCMEAHSDYYSPVLRAEKAAEEEAVRQLEQEIKDSKEMCGEMEKEKEKVKENSSSGNEKKST